MNTLSIIESAYRATIEEQDDTVVWIHGAMKAVGADVVVLLRGNAVNYLVEGQDCTGLAFGEWRQTQPPRIANDLAALIDKGVEICYVAEDLVERGVEVRQLISGVRPVTRGAVADLIAGYGRVWHW